MKAKELWKGLFSYRCEMEKLYAKAYSKEQARVMMCRRLAKKHEVNYGAVLALFDGSKDNFDITIEKEKVNVKKNVATNTSALL